MLVQKGFENSEGGTRLTKCRVSLQREAKTSIGSAVFQTRPVLADPLRHKRGALSREIKSKTTLFVWEGGRTDLFTDLATNLLEGMKQTPLKIPNSPPRSSKMRDVVSFLLQDPHDPYFIPAEKKKKKKQTTLTKSPPPPPGGPGR